MGDNGSKENLEIKSQDAPQEILRVDLIGGPTGKVIPKINSNYIPMLCFAIKLLEVEVQKMIINTQIDNAKQGIIIPQKRHNIIDFLRGKK